MFRRSTTALAVLLTALLCLGSAAGVATAAKSGSGKNQQGKKAGGSGKGKGHKGKGGKGKAPKPPTRRIKTKLVARYRSGTLTDPYSPDPYGENAFKGRAGARKSCQKRRTILVKDDRGTVVATGLTTPKGRFTIASGNPRPGSYVLKAAKRVNFRTKRVRSHKFVQKIVCKGGRTRVTVPLASLRGPASDVTLQR